MRGAETSMHKGRAAAWEMWTLRKLSDCTRTQYWMCKPHFTTPRNTNCYQDAPSQVKHNAASGVARRHAQGAHCRTWCGTRAPSWPFEKWQNGHRWVKFTLNIDTKQSSGVNYESILRNAVVVMYPHNHYIVREVVVFTAFYISTHPTAVNKVTT